MKSSYMHFAYMPDEIQTEKTADEFAAEIELEVDKILQQGKNHGTIHIDLPDDLSEEDALKFIQEIMKRLEERDDTDE